MGNVTITLPRLPDPVPPDGFVLSGYEVQYDGPTDETGEAKTLSQARAELEAELSGNFRVYADCKDDSDGEMTTEWDERKKVWGEWEWK